MNERIKTAKQAAQEVSRATGIPLVAQISGRGELVEFRAEYDETPPDGKTIGKALRPLTNRFLTVARVYQSGVGCVEAVYPQVAGGYIVIRDSDRVNVGGQRFSTIRDAYYWLYDYCRRMAFASHKFSVVRGDRKRMNDSEMCESSYWGQGS